jgi:hypothetical protein
LKKRDELAKLAKLQSIQQQEKLNEQSMTYAMETLKDRANQQKEIEMMTSQRIMDMEKELAEHKLNYAK